MAKLIQKPVVKPKPKPEPAAEDTPQSVGTERGVYCTHGIHAGHYPIQGKTVAEARELLGGILNIDPQAVAVINGQQVEDEDAAIIEGVEHLNFVKQAAVKGSGYSLSVTEDGAFLSRGTGNPTPVDIPKLSANMVKQKMLGDHDEPLPTGTAWRVDQGSNTVLILQLDPALRRLRIAREGYGSDATYEFLRLATPFVVLKVPCKEGRVQPRCELFYTNKPLRKLDDELFMSNLLNVSPNACGVTAWFCSQYLYQGLSASKMEGMSLFDWCDLLVKHLWDSGMNRSSEAHEGNSCFSLYEKADSADRRVRDFDTWQSCSTDDPMFVLGVNWMKSGMTPRKLIDRELELLGGGKKRQVRSAADLLSAATAACS